MWYLVSGGVCLLPVLYKSSLHHTAPEHIQEDCCTSCSNFSFLVFKFLYVKLSPPANLSHSSQQYHADCPSSSMQLANMARLILLRILAEVKLGS